jgi:AcrR family transcriptional regulator
VGRREEILRVALDLFAERGFFATPTAEVARRAGVAEGTIFHHFKTKQGVLQHIFQEMMDEYFDGVTAAVSGSRTGMEAVERIVRFHFRFSEEKSRELSVVIRDFPSNLMQLGSPFRELVAARLSSLTDLVAECIERGKTDGSIRDVPARQTAFVLRGTCDGLARMRLLGPLDIPEMTEEVVAFCRRALASRG